MNRILMGRMRLEMRFDNRVGIGMEATQSTKTNAAGMNAPQKERAQAESNCQNSLEKWQPDILEESWRDE